MDSRTFKNAFNMLKIALKRYQDDGCSLKSAGIAFFGLFSIFPFLVLLLSIFGYVFSRPWLLGGNATLAITSFLERFFPAQTSIIFNTVKQVIIEKGKMGITGILILIWASRGLFMAMEHSINEIWKGENSRSYIFRNLIAFFVMFLLGAILALSTLFSTGLVWLRTLDLGLYVLHVDRLLVWDYFNKYIFSTLIVFVIFAVLYVFLPHREVKLKEILPGAIFSTLLWKLAEFAYLYYMRFIATFSAIYGSIGSILGMMIWLYILSIVFLLGMEFNVSYWKVRNDDYIELRNRNK